MFRLIVELYRLLEPSQRNSFLRLQVLVVLMSFSEVLVVAAISSFMALIGDKSVMENAYFGYVYKELKFSEYYEFVFAYGLLVICLIIISSIISITTVWKLSGYAYRIGAEFSNRLYLNYLSQNWLYHASNNSSKLTKQVSVEAGRVTSGVLSPLMQMNARALLAFSMIISVFVFNPMVAIVGVLIFLSSYLALYWLVRGRLHKNGSDISTSNTARYALMEQGFVGIKDVLLFHKRSIFTDKFDRESFRLAGAQGENQVLSQVPRYYIELVAFLAIVSLILYLIKNYDGNLSQILPVLALYAMAGFKLLPACQQIYASITKLKANMPAFLAIREDLRLSVNSEGGDSGEELAGDIELKNISFSYPGSNTKALDNVDIVIPENKAVGIVGASGSGKSTLIDILLGLIKPQGGRLRVADIDIDDTNLRCWQNQIGFVPQAIYLSNSTIAENIAFGEYREDIATDKVAEAVKMSHLEPLVDQLPDGLNTLVGDRGVKLSGGQRQRIGIARALYRRGGVLILDEATSALDGLTERVVMDAINDFSGKKTIVMVAHRLKTIEKCDIIYLIDKGKVVDFGTYSELIDKNETFRKMAQHA